MTPATDDLLDGSPIWTTQRRELVQWLDDNAPSFTAAYVTAVRLLHDTALPARVHLVCHLVRDIYRFLPAALGLKTGYRLSDVIMPIIPKLVQAWDNSGPGELVDGELDLKGRVVSPGVYKEVEAIVAKSRDYKEQPSVGAQLAIALFRSVERRRDEYLPEWIKESFQKEFIFFTRRAHLALRMDDVPTAEGLVEHFESFERSFHSLIGRYFTGKEELDAILRDTNAPAG